MTLPDSFWAKTSVSDCIIWHGAQNSKGYGCYAVGGVSQLAHRLAWIDANGPIPDDMTIDHLCRVHACVNVAHLELVSVAENIRRQPRALYPGANCRNGHPIISEADMYIRKNGSAECRKCRRENKRRFNRADIEAIKAGDAA